MCAFRRVAACFPSSRTLYIANNNSNAIIDILQEKNVCFLNLYQVYLIIIRYIGFGAQNMHKYENRCGPVRGRTGVGYVFCSDLFYGLIAFAAIA